MVDRPGSAILTQASRRIGSWQTSWGSGVSPVRAPSRREYRGGHLGVLSAPRALRAYSVPTSWRELGPVVFFLGLKQKNKGGQLDKKDVNRFKSGPLRAAAC